MDEQETGGEQRRAPRHRGSTLGSVLIVLGIVLLGAAVSLAAAGGRPAGRVASVTPPPDRIATPGSTLAPPVIQAAPATTPTPPQETSAATTTPAPATPAPSPTAIPTRTPVPDRPHATQIKIPAIGLDAPIVEVGYDVVEIEGVRVIQWQVADYAAGHHSTSADPGEGGNIVIAGHDDWRGEVFRDLEHLTLGDHVILVTPGGEHTYAVTEIVYRKEAGMPIATRIATGQYFAPMPEERLTLVTCWPYGIDDHRLIVIAKPVRP
jgi:sortase A